jgi:NADPH-dependent ferric siderophore reductase
MGIIENLLKLRLQPAEIVYKAPLSPSAFHIRLKSEKLKYDGFVPGYFLRLGAGMDDEASGIRDKVRSYTAWDYDAVQGTVDLAVATHSQGVGTKWAQRCEVGDEVYFTWHKCKLVVDDIADSYLMIGDLSALAHLYKIRRHLPNKQIQGIFYSQNQTDLFKDIDGAEPFSLYGMPDNPVEQLKEKIDAALPTMTGKKMVYLAGDSRVCVALNHYFRKELNWETRQIKTKPFWNPNKKGLD